MTDTPEDWVLIEAAKRSGWGDNGIHCSAYTRNQMFRALCDMIAKHEQKPVDRKLLCALEAAHQWDGTQGPVSWVGRRAIELWIEGKAEQ